MTGLTLTQAQTEYDATLAQYQKVRDSLASGSHNNRSFQNHQLETLRKELREWDREVKRLSRAGISVSRVVMHG